VKINDLLTVQKLTIPGALKQLQLKSDDNVIEKGLLDELKSILAGFKKINF